MFQFQETAAPIDESSVEVSIALPPNEQDRAWGGVGMGGTLSWMNNRYSLNYEGLVNTSLNQFANSYTLQGNVSFRISF